MSVEPPTYPMELVVWHDAAGTNGDWRDLASITPELSLIYSVGYVVQESEDAIALVPHVDLQDAVGNGEMAIPKATIRSRQRLGPVPMPAMTGPC